MLLGGLILRIILAPIWLGYDRDVNTFMAWAYHAITYGLPGLYADQSYFLDYPPGYIYVLYLLALIHQALGLHWGSGASIILFKMPAMLADLALSYALYAIARRLKHMNNLQCLGIASLYLLNPAVLLNSAIWGQIDAFFMVFVLTTFLLQQQGRLRSASALMALTILIKPQALLFCPLLLIDVLNRRNLKLFVQCLVSGCLTIVLITLPFSFGKGFSWLFELYYKTLASYPYASLNAFNLLTLLGGNFIRNSQKVGGISYEVIGWIMMAAVLFYSCYLYVKNKGKSGALFYISFLLITAVFVCTTKMHERYLYYGLLLSLTSFLYIRDRRILWLFIAFSLTNAINVADVFIPSLDHKYFIPRYDSLLMVISAANVLLLAFAGWLGWRLKPYTRGIQ